MVRYWCGYLSAARCKWFAYGPADATTTPSSLTPVKSRMVYSFWCQLTQGVPDKRPLNGHTSSSNSSSKYNTWLVINLTSAIKEFCSGCWSASVDQDSAKLVPNPWMRLAVCSVARRRNARKVRGSPRDLQRYAERHLESMCIWICFQSSDVILKRFSRWPSQNTCKKKIS